MRLTNLSPRWVAALDAPDGTRHGISFLCPHCYNRPNPVRLAIFFTPTIEGPLADINTVHRQQAITGHLCDHHVGAILWNRVSGSDFDTLTLTPSIDASKWGCWHGCITNGAIA